MFIDKPAHFVWTLDDETKTGAEIIPLLTVGYGKIAYSNTQK
jgi:hypothetical protein